MSKLNNPLELYKLLPKSNCKLCGVATCLAFAAEVIKGQKRLDECPHLESQIIEEFDGKIIRQATPEEQLKLILVPLKKEIATMDLSASVKRLGATLSGDKLIIKCLGKDFTVDSKGNIISDCHINEWVTVPLLNYIISSAGNDPSGKWVPFRELSNETIWNSYFEHKFEKPLKQLTDVYPDLIEDIIFIFSGKPVENRFSYDISLVLKPLPKVPMLICYTKPQEDLESKLNVFFDTTAEDNLNIDSIYRLCVGLLMMFQKITSKHIKA
ncbi:MAG: Fe-S cluster protein [Desulfosporosinus sp. BRH_c37]|nr:MAG: Fe-S cluster protein [Desulfosporosinus sp. BRH_c37]